MNRTKRILCALIVFTIALPVAFADASTDGLEGAQTAVVETTDQQGTPPADVPATEPEDAPTDTPSEAPTAEPTQEATAAPTDASTAEPTSAPTQTPESTAAPTAQPTAMPTQTPEAQYKIEIDGNAQCSQDNIWQIPYQTAQDTVTFRWSQIDSALSYLVSITYEKDAVVNEVYTSSETQTTLTIPVSALANETYTMTVSAYAFKPDDEGYDVNKPLMQMQIQFVLTQSQVNPDGGFPSGGGTTPSGGSFPSGIISGGTISGGDMQDGMMPEEQGFHVTPGEALTDSHASGDKTMTPFGAVEIALSEDSMTKLTVDETTLDIVLDDEQSAFYAAQYEDALILTPEADGEEWSVSMFALKTLGRSGVDSVKLVLGETTIEIPTDLSLNGTIYGKLSAQGYVSKDYTLTVTAQGINVLVAGQEYTIDENNELVGE